MRANAPRRDTMCDHLATIALRRFSSKAATPYAHRKLWQPHPATCSATTRSLTSTSIGPGCSSRRRSGVASRGRISKRSRSAQAGSGCARSAACCLPLSAPSRDQRALDDVWNNRRFRKSRSYVEATDPFSGSDPASRCPRRADGRRRPLAGPVRRRACLRRSEAPHEAFICTIGHRQGAHQNRPRQHHSLQHAPAPVLGDRPPRFGTSNAPANRPRSPFNADKPPT